MAFKIESIEDMKAIAETMNQYSQSAQSESNKVVTAVENLAANITGGDVDASLTKLRDSITNYSGIAVDTLNTVSIFIKTQVASYAQNEDNTSDALSNVQSELDGIVL